MLSNHSAVKTFFVGERFLFFCYQGLLQILIFLASRFEKWLPYKVQAYLRERSIPQLVWRLSPQKERRRVWFHAASGEIEYIKPLLRLWKLRCPHDLLFLTYTSTSARSMIAATRELDGWAPLPLDLPNPCRQFLKQLSPSILIISRTDLWPTLLREAHLIPQILVASTWSIGSKKTRGLGRWMSRWCLTYLSKVCVVTQEDAQELRRISSQTLCAVTGDPRFDQVLYRLQLQRPTPAKIKVWCENSFTLVAGSTWPEDESVLLEAWKKASLDSSFPRSGRLIIVPHETHSLEILEQKLHSFDLSFHRWSYASLSEEPLVHSILIFDQKGWLAELYQWAQVALIGGSYKKQVHSVMEALGWGTPVWVGPYYLNNREAIEFAKQSWQEHPFVEMIPNSIHLTQRLLHHAHIPSEQHKNYRRAILTAFNFHCGATEKTFVEIQNSL